MSGEGSSVRGEGKGQGAKPVKHVRHVRHFRHVPVREVD